MNIIVETDPIVSVCCWFQQRNQTQK